MTNSNSRFYTYLDGKQLQPWYQIEIVICSPEFTIGMG